MNGRWDVGELMLAPVPTLTDNRSSAMEEVDGQLDERERCRDLQQNAGSNDLEVR